MKPFHYLFMALFAIGVIAPAFSEARVSEGHKKAAKYMKALPQKGHRAPASAGKHKVKHAKNHKKSPRKPASKKKAKKIKSHSKKSKRKSRTYGA